MTAPVRLAERLAVRSQRNLAALELAVTPAARLSVAADWLRSLAAAAEDFGPEAETQVGEIVARAARALTGCAKDADAVLSATVSPRQAAQPHAQGVPA